METLIPAAGDRRSRGRETDGRGEKLENCKGSTSAQSGSRSSERVGSVIESISVQNPTNGRRRLES